MGRPSKELDVEAIYDVLERGVSRRDAAEMFGCSVPTLTKRIADIQKNQGLLLQYRQLQALHLTELQSRILEAITPEKIEMADLKDLVTAYKVLKDKELVVEGKPNEIKGLVSYLVHIEKENLACSSPVVVSPEAEYDDVDVEEKMPEL
jgi:hypothetical protein